MRFCIRRRSESSRTVMVRFVIGLIRRPLRLRPVNSAPKLAKSAESRSVSVGGRGGDCRRRLPSAPRESRMFVASLVMSLVRKLRFSLKIGKFWEVSRKFRESSRVGVRADVILLYWQNIFFCPNRRRSTPISREPRRVRRSNLAQTARNGLLRTLLPKRKSGDIS